MYTSFNFNQYLAKQLAYLTHLPTALRCGFGSLLVFTLLLASSAPIQATPFTSTSLQGGGTNADICIGDTQTFISGITGCGGCGSYPHEWVISRSTNFGNNYTHYQTVTQSNGAPLTFTFNDPGYYEVKVYVRDPNTNAVIAWPCTSNGSAGTCTRAKVTVNGPVSPSFTVNKLGCSYDPNSGMYTSQVSILPAVDQVSPASQWMGTQLLIDWGDGSPIQQLTVYSNTNYTPITHTYTIPAATANSYIIAVDASGYCADIGFSTYYSPVDMYYDLQPVVIEDNCERHVVCFEGLYGMEGIELYGPNGEVGDFYNDECLTFIVSGTYTIVIPIPNSCPQVHYYTVNIKGDPGTFSIPTPSITPGQPMDLSLSGYNGYYIAYEILIDNCNGAPQWVLFEYGPASTYDNHTVHPGTTAQFLPCMLNENFEFCFRARILCEPFDPETYENSAISNVVCVPVCASGEEIPGGGDNNPAMQGVDTQEVPAIDLIAPKDTDAPADYKLYPNPTSGIFQIDLGHSSTGQAIELDITNAIGQTVWNDFIEEASGAHQIDLSGLSPGTYFVRIQNGKGPAQMKTVILTP